MEFEKTVNLQRSRDKNGLVMLQRPTAGVVNKARRLSTTNSKSEIEMQLILQEELLPYCIKTHPWGTTPVKEALKLIDYEDYDMLCTELSNLMKASTEQIVKKPEESSEMENAQTGGS